MKMTRYVSLISSSRTDEIITNLIITKSVPLVIILNIIRRQIYYAIELLAHPS
jgi:hypothetical protein